MIRILLVSQFLFICNALASVLEQESDMEVVGSAISVREALDLVSKTDLVLVNVQMPNNDAFKLIRAISGAEIPVKVLALGLTETKDHVLQYLQAGASGYVLKDDSVDDLLQRIRDVHAGQIQVSPMIASALISRLNEYSLLLSQVKSGIGQNSTLTEREEEILALVGQGLTNQEFADQLVIEVGTVKNHVHNILQKLDVNTRQEAATTWSIVKNGERFLSRAF
jgi:DNA-binding NarL/FixJ family response regulator